MRSVPRLRTGTSMKRGGGRIKRLAGIDYNLKRHSYKYIYDYKVTLYAISLVQVAMLLSRYVLHFLEFQTL